MKRRLVLAAAASLASTGAWAQTPERLFKLFPNLGEMPNRPGGRMSGGEQQMLTVARTLMGNPLLVLLAMHLSASLLSRRSQAGAAAR